MKTLALIYASEGTGHKSAAFALREAFLAANPEGNALCLDILDFVPPFMKGLLSGGYDVLLLGLRQTRRTGLGLRVGSRAVLPRLPAEAEAAPRVERRGSGDIHALLRSRGVRRDEQGPRASVLRGHGL